MASKRTRALRTRRAKRNNLRRAKNLKARDDAIEALEDAEQRPRIVRYQSALERYRARTQISDEQYAAGKRFQDDWIGMGKILSPGRISAASLEEWIGARFVDPTPYQLDCKQRVDAAIRAVGRGLASVLINVCLYDLSASDWAAIWGKRPVNDGIACLRLALDSLRDHYRTADRQAYDNMQQLAACA